MAVSMSQPMLKGRTDAQTKVFDDTGADRFQQTPLFDHLKMRAIRVPRNVWIGVLLIVAALLFFAQRFPFRGTVDNAVEKTKKEWNSASPVCRPSMDRHNKTSIRRIYMVHMRKAGEPLSFDTWNMWRDNSNLSWITTKVVRWSILELAMIQSMSLTFEIHWLALSVASSTKSDGTASN